MKKVVTGVCLVSVLFTGCAREYEANMSARSQIAYTESTNRRMAVGEVMDAVGVVISGFETAYNKKKDDEIENILSSSSNTIVLSDVQYGFQQISNITIAIINSHAEQELARLRVEVFKYLTPIIEAIYKDHADKMGTPMSTNEVVASLIKQVPFLATVAGMYGLGYQGMKSAGDTISNNISGDNTGTIANKSNIADSGSIIGNDNTSDGNNCTDGDCTSEVEESEWYNGIEGCSTEESYLSCLCSTKPESCN